MYPTISDVDCSSYDSGLSFSLSPQAWPSRLSFWSVGSCTFDPSNKSRSGSVAVGITLWDLSCLLQLRPQPSSSQRGAVSRGTIKLYKKGLEATSMSGTFLLALPTGIRKVATSQACLPAEGLQSQSTLDSAISCNHITFYFGYAVLYYTYSFFNAS